MSRTWTAPFFQAPGAQPVRATAPQPAAPARPQANTAAADQKVDQAVRDILGRAATPQELAQWRAGDPRAMREALVNQPAFEQRARAAWGKWVEDHPRDRLGFDAGRLKSIREHVIKGDAMNKAIGFVFTGGYISGVLFAAYLKSVEDEARKNRPRGA